MSDPFHPHCPSCGRNYRRSVITERNSTIHCRCGRFALFGRIMQDWKWHAPEAHFTYFNRAFVGMITCSGCEQVGRGHVANDGGCYCGACSNKVVRAQLGRWASWPEAGKVEFDRRSPAQFYLTGQIDLAN
jgi:hypothetical protein